MSTYLLAPDALDPASPATQLVSGVGNQVLDVAVGLAPVVVPFILAMTAIGWVLRKFGVAGSAALVSGTGPFGESMMTTDKPIRKRDMVVRDLYRDHDAADPDCVCDRCFTRKMNHARRG